MCTALLETEGETINLGYGRVMWRGEATPRSEEAQRMRSNTGKKWSQHTFVLHHQHPILEESVWPLVRQNQRKAAGPTNNHTIVSYHANVFHPARSFALLEDGNKSEG
jgi:hypothetical protein